jgi:hypothetical protein
MIYEFSCKFAQYCRIDTIIVALTVSYNGEFP